MATDKTTSMGNVIHLRRPQSGPTPGWAEGALCAIDLFEDAYVGDAATACSLDPQWRKKGVPQRDIVTPILVRLVDDDMRVGFAAMLSHILSHMLAADGGVPNPEWLECLARLPPDEAAAEWRRLQSSESDGGLNGDGA